MANCFSRLLADRQKMKVCWHKVMYLYCYLLKYFVKIKKRYIFACHEWSKYEKVEFKDLFFMDCGCFVDNALSVIIL